MIQQTCRRGHPFVEGSYYQYGNSRHCKACLCQRNRAYSQGRTLPKPDRKDVLGRKITILENGCLEWQNYRREAGCGLTNVNGRSVGAHEAFYELYATPVPEGLELDHLCHDPSCVNPDHLEAVPHWTNLMRSDCPSAINARKTECPQGHALSGSDLCIEHRSNGKDCRRCKICMRVQRNESRRRKQSISIQA